MLPSTESRRQYPVRSWKSLPLEQAERSLEALGLQSNQPEQALICTRCKYALKPSGETVSKHLWEKHQIPPEERHGLSAYVKDLHLTDPTNSLLGRTDPNHIPTYPYSRALSAGSVVIDQRVSNWLDAMCPKLMTSRGRGAIWCVMRLSRT
jgi:hypothetical protein